MTRKYSIMLTFQYDRYTIRSFVLKQHDCPLLVCRVHEAVPEVAAGNFLC